MLYIYITFYLNGSGEVNVMKIVNGTRASSDGIINSLRENRYFYYTTISESSLQSLSKKVI